MEQTLQALGGILLRAIPTVCLLVLLHFYLKGMLFGPLEKILKQRDELTEGARKAAREGLAAAERTAEAYETRLREARAEVYRQQEETRRQWLEEQASQIAAAHERSAGTVRQAKQQIAAEAASARQNLIGTSGALADQIAAAVLSRGPQ